MLAHRNLLGGSSEALVAAYLAAIGAEVFAATQSHSRADLVYVHGDRTVKVQVKTASSFMRGNHRYEQCRLVRKGINIPYTQDEVDEIWIVGTHLWRFPLEVVCGMTSITLLCSNQKPRKTVRTYNPNGFIEVSGSIEFPYKDRALFSVDGPLMMNNNSYSAHTQRKMDRLTSQGARDD